MSRQAPTPASRARRARVRAIALPLVVVIAAASVSAGCSSASSSAGAAASTDPATVSDDENQLVLGGNEYADGAPTGDRPWDGSAEEQDTDADVDGTTVSTSRAPLLTDDDDDPAGDADDPFAKLLRVPPVRAAWALPGPTIPAAVRPNPAVLDSRELRAAELGVVKVMLEKCGGMGAGSGWVPRAGTVVTNAHVVSGATGSPWVQVFNGTRYEATLVGLDVANDIAILEVPGLAGVTPLPMDVTPTAGEPGAILGFPHGGGYLAREAELGSEQTDVTQMVDGWGAPISSRRNIYASGFVEPGGSGGPIVNEDGAVMATVWGAVVGTTRPVAAAIPNRLVSAALARAGSTELDAGPCTAR